MLHINVPGREFFNEKSQEFITIPGASLALEHSLVSISKWESKWHKPFLDSTEKTQEEVLDYIKCMTLTQNVNPDTYSILTTENMSDINSYINDSMTATTFTESKTASHKKEVVTSELVYYWMIALQIPFECQKWHINRLLTLIRVCNIKNQSPKKMSKNDILSRNKSLNAARKAKLHSRG
jgi:hypothetical protein